MSDPDLAHRSVYTFLAQLQSLGVERVFVAPGSRSTVLALQAYNLFGSNLITHFDERGLGFLALGAAKASRKPTCIITTSGTAVANLLPAVIEARYSHVPLIIISADRPPEMHHRGCNQTIDQRELFGQHAVAYHELLPPDTSRTREEMQSEALAVWQAATHAGDEGAVQVNWMFREPFFANERADAEAPRDTPAPVSPPPQRTNRSDNLSLLTTTINKTARGVCVVGALEDPADAASVAHFIEKLGWITFADSLSQLRQGRGLPNVLTHGDVSLLAPLPAELQPDTIIHIGGRLVSKRIATLVGPAHGATIISVTPHSEPFDPNYGIQTQIGAALQELPTREVSPHVDPLFAQGLLQRHSRVAARLADLFDVHNEQLSEPAVLRALSLQTPSTHILMLGNSMPIRDFEMFASARADAPRTIANRGASGIDGLIATACGAAIGCATPLTLVLGDLSTLHDLNSLALARSVRTPFPIVVINNDGGGIFSLLPVAKTAHFEPLFGTPHGLSFQDVARGFGLPYASPTSMREFLREYQIAAHRPGASLIEVTTERASNAELHRSINNAISIVASS
jgi:2-succinyl-5-enolpyruvyl-6-hydroxy-3-cyclohexene-1-carboxylate synthase